MSSVSFTNELGNRISLSVDVREDGLVNYVMEGPTSTTDQTITKREAATLARMLGSLEGEEVVVPIIHLNGDRAETLLDALFGAIDAVHAAGDALAKCSPNGRNFYLKPGLMESASAQHEQRMNALRGLVVSLTAEVEGIQNQA